MKKLSALLMAIALYAPLPAQAQQLDLATVTCKDFIASDKQTIGLILMWLEGYYSDPRQADRRLRQDEGGWRQARRVLRQESRPQPDYRGR